MLLTLRNLTWNPVRYAIRLDGEIGLNGSGIVEVRQFHPTERILGSFDRGSVIEVEVPPFRSCLIAATTAPLQEIGISGVDYEMVRDVPDRPVSIRLLGLPGTQATIALSPAGRDFASAEIDGVPASELLRGLPVEVSFPGEAFRDPLHRKLGDMVPSEVPDDADALYEATVFAADNNALEVRSLYRSGPTAIPQVQAARDAFFGQEILVERGIWDRNLFDDNPTTSFYHSNRFGGDIRINGGAFRLDFGQPISLDRLVFHVPDAHGLQPLKPDEAVAVEISADLREWKRQVLLSIPQILSDSCGSQHPLTAWPRSKGI